MGSGLSRHCLPSVGGTFSTRQPAVKTCLHQNGKHFRPVPQKRKRKYRQGDSRTIPAEPAKLLNCRLPEARKTAIRRPFS
ncbi:hypothetical protein REMIM1_CH01541 [Rhizobium etli bv. mimosae str. Mim1]|nr:hypothetical protein REMIM1_CH01541 [Rhizobium etli bv. mimosae str. Mim1]